MRLLTVEPHTTPLSSPASLSQPPVVPIRSALTTAGSIYSTSHSSKDMQTLLSHITRKEGRTEEEGRKDDGWMDGMDGWHGWMAGWMDGWMVIGWRMDEERRMEEENENWPGRKEWNERNRSKNG